jgi:hypothetical protein
MGKLPELFFCDKAILRLRPGHDPQWYADEKILAPEKSEQANDDTIKYDSLDPLATGIKKIKSNSFPNELQI